MGGEHWLAAEHTLFYDELDAIPFEAPEDACEGWQKLCNTFSASGRTAAQVYEFMKRELELLRMDPELAAFEQPFDVVHDDPGFQDEDGSPECKLAAWEELRGLGCYGVGASSAGSEGVESVGDPRDSAAESSHRVKGNRVERGKAWSEDEHKLFLVGLERFGKGDWRSISRESVKTRTPAQVASHAQKYFLRQEETASGRLKRRVSIHDIVSVEGSLPPSKKRMRSKASNALAAGESAITFPPLDLNLAGTPCTMPPSRSPTNAPGSATELQKLLQPAAQSALPTLQWAPVQKLPSGRLI